MLPVYSLGQGWQPKARNCSSVQKKRHGVSNYTVKCKSQEEGNEWPMERRSLVVQNKEDREVAL